MNCKIAVETNPNPSFSSLLCHPAKLSKNNNLENKKKIFDMQRQ